MLTKMLGNNVIEEFTDEDGDNQAGFQLEYYLTESTLSFPSETNQKKVYGIKIVKKTKDDELENVQFPDVSTSYEETMQLIQMLERNTVTPVTLQYILEDCIGY